MKVIIVCGTPGTGKSTLFKNLIGDAPADFRQGLVRGHRVGNVLFLGVYEPNVTYPGTDRLSMAVQPKFQQLLRNRAELGLDAIVFEGDRLTNPSLVNYIDSLKIERHVFCLQVSQAVLDKRRAARGDTFAENWLRGRETKVNNFVKAATRVTFLRNETNDDMVKNLELLSGLVYGVA